MSEHGNVADPVLADGWVTRTLGDICRVGGGSVQTGPFGSQLHAEDYKDDGTPIITVEHLREGGITHENLPLVGAADYRRLARYQLATGDLVFSRVGAIDRCAYVSEAENGWLFSGRCLRVRTGNSRTDSRYLAYVLNSWRPRQWILNHAVGSTMACLNTGILSDVPVTLAPEPEQAKIAEVLSTVDRAIEQTEALIAKQQSIKTGLMQDLLTRGIDEHGNLRSEATHKFKNSPIGRIPVNWDVSTLNGCVRRDAPICYGILMPGRGFDNGVPVIKVKDIMGGRIQQNDLLLTDPRIDRLYRRSRLRSGDLLITIRGTTGRIAVVPSSLTGANITQDTARVRLVDRCLTEFFFFQLQFRTVQEQISLHTIGQAVKGINIGDVKRLVVAVPSRDEQGQIAARLEAAEAIIYRMEQDATKLRAIKRGLMQDLLSGTRRVTALLEQREEATT